MLGRLELDRRFVRGLGKVDEPAAVASGAEYFRQMSAAPRLFVVEINGPVRRSGADVEERDQQAVPVEIVQRR